MEHEARLRLLHDMRRNIQDLRAERDAGAGVAKLDQTLRAGQ
jgi:hypothetical protein